MAVKNNTKKIPPKSAIVDDNIGNYEKHPFFVKKAAAAKALMLKAGMPAKLTGKNYAS